MREELFEEDRGFFQRYGFPLGIGAVGIAVAAIFIGQIAHHQAPTRHTQEVVMVRPLPPPPQQPTPPPPEPPKEIVQKMIEQTPMDKPEDKPDDSPKGPAPVTTNVTGTGSDAFGLSGGGRGGSGGGGGTHSRWGWYAGQVQRVVQDALQRNRVTSTAEFTEKMKIWADASGRVTRMKLERSTGSADVDRAIAEAIEGIQLQEPPPSDMPMPITMRVSARRKT